MVSLSERDEFRSTVLGDLGLDDIGVRRPAGLAPKSTAMTRAAAGVGGGASAFSASPIQSRGGLREIEIAIDAVDHALAAERRKPFVDLLADGAEFHIGRVAQRQHAELDAVETRRALAHQFAVAAHGARRRLAFAPGRGDDHQAASCWRASRRRDRPCRSMVGFRPFLRAALAISPASRSELPDSLAKTMVSGSAGTRAARPAAAPPTTASTPARNPASQARCDRDSPDRRRG